MLSPWLCMYNAVTMADCLKLDPLFDHAALINFIDLQCETVNLLLCLN